MDRLARQLASEMGGRAGFSRRGFLRASGMGAFALTSGGLLAACGTEGTKQTADTCKSTDQARHREGAALLELAALHG